MDERPPQRRPHDLQASRAGAVLGGVAGFTPVMIVVFLTGRFVPPLWELLAGVITFGGLGGALSGMAGGRVGRWIRDRRAGSWSDYRASLAGGYVGGALGGLLTMGT